MPARDSLTERGAVIAPVAGLVVALIFVAGALMALAGMMRKPAAA